MSMAVAGDMGLLPAGLEISVELRPNKMADGHAAVPRGTLQPRDNIRIHTKRDAFLALCHFLLLLPAPRTMRGYVGHSKPV